LNNHNVRVVWSWVREILLGILIFLFVTAFIGRMRHIPSESMEPTLMIGDRLWTDKITYYLRKPQHGDIVIFDPPPSLGSDIPFVKRVIGEPGDEIRIEGEKVYVNGKALDEPYIAEEPSYTWGPQKVPADSLFVMGDNRNHSNDSHAWGFLPIKSVTARVVFRLWPLPRIGAVH
jgi:signal peptidase I